MLCLGIWNSKNDCKKFVLKFTPTFPWIFSEFLIKNLKLF